MNETPDIGNYSYSCTFASHRWCDGETESGDYTNPAPRCDCPCHNDDVRLKGAA